MAWESGSGRSSGRRSPQIYDEIFGSRSTQLATCGGAREGCRTATGAGARPFGCAGPSCSRSYGFASRKRRASGRARRAKLSAGSNEGGELDAQGLLIDSSVGDAGGARKVCLTMGISSSARSPHRFCSPARRVSGLEAARRHVPDEWQAGTHRASAAAARPRPKKSLDARSLPGRSLLLRLHPRHDAVQLLRPL